MYKGCIGVEDAQMKKKQYLRGDGQEHQLLKYPHVVHTHTQTPHTCAHTYMHVHMCTHTPGTLVAGGAKISCFI